MEWTERIIAWMDKTGRDPDRLAGELGVSVRSVHRWRWGDEIPDDVAQTKLMVMGAPTPPRAAKPKPQAPTKVELKLEELHVSLREVTEQIARLQRSPVAVPPTPEQAAWNDEIGASLRRMDERLAGVETAPSPPPPVAEQPPWSEEILAALRQMDQRLAGMETALNAPRPPEAPAAGIEEALAPLRLLDERLLRLEDIFTALQLLSDRMARIEKELL